MLGRLFSGDEPDECAEYVALLLSQNFMSLDGLLKLFSNRTALFAGWIHYIVRRLSSIFFYYRSG